MLKGRLALAISSLQLALAAVNACSLPHRYVTSPFCYVLGTWTQRTRFVTAAVDSITKKYNLIPLITKKHNLSQYEIVQQYTIVIREIQEFFKYPS